jgi:hypothetical protein
VAEEVTAATVDLVTLEATGDLTVPVDQVRPEDRPEPAHPAFRDLSHLQSSS